MTSLSKRRRAQKKARKAKSLRRRAKSQKDVSLKLVTTKKPSETIPVVAAKPAPVAGETPKEVALRLETERLRGLLKKERVGEILATPPGAIQQKPSEITPASKKILEKYKPEQIAELKDVLGVLADDMGYVKKGELDTRSYIQVGEDALASFIDDHPEYNKENDPTGALWGQFKQEYSMFVPPKDPKDFKKIFNRVHQQIFGIQAKGDLGKITAAKEKITVASHTGASSPARAPSRPQANTNTTGLRLDMLKGFSDEEIAELQG